MSFDPLMTLTHPNVIQGAAVVLVEHGILEGQMARAAIGH